MSTVFDRVRAAYAHALLTQINHQLDTIRALGILPPVGEQEVRYSRRAFGDVADDLAAEHALPVPFERPCHDTV